MLGLETHSGDLNAENPGGRDGYSQNPVTTRQRQAADSALLDFAKNTGGILVSPPVPTWRRGDGTQSVTLDHVVLINFQDSKATTVAESLGDIHHDHLCLSLDLDLTVFGEWVLDTPPTAPK